MTPRLTIEQWIQILNYGKRRPNLRTPFDKQLNLLAYLFQKDPNRVKQVDLCCGRRFGKSYLLIIAATIMLAKGPEQIGLFLEPDWKRVNRVFLRAWQTLVPKHLYTLNKGERCITWNPTGAQLFYGPRNITGSYDTSEDSQLGVGVTFVIDDEAALRCSESFYLNNLMAISEPSDVRFYLTASTPRIGIYNDLISSKGHVIFRGKSTDNPYLPEGHIEHLRAQYSTAQARREIDGEMISLEGSLWPDWSDEMWPLGNIHPHTHNDKLPFYLAFDIGASSSAWLLLQALDDVWVVTAEYMPMRAGEGALDKIALKIKQRFGTPAAVVVGSDVDTYSNYNTGITGRKIIRSVFEERMPIREVKTGSPKANKEIQKMQLEFGICGPNRRREFCVSVALDDRLTKDPSELMSFPHPREHKRGILQVMREDHWPDRITSSNVWTQLKEHRLEHARDSALYFAVNLGWPPGYTVLDAVA